MAGEKPVRLAMHGGWWTFARVMRERKPFIGGGGPCHGTPVDVGSFGTTRSIGKMSVADAVQAATGKSINSADYVVFSYETPIAWHIPGVHEWIIPAARYTNDDGNPSKTTTRHQNLIRTAAAHVAEADAKAARAS